MSGLIIKKESLNEFQFRYLKEITFNKGVQVY